MEHICTNQDPPHPTQKSEWSTFKWLEEYTYFSSNEAMETLNKDTKWKKYSIQIELETLLFHVSLSLSLSLLSLCPMQITEDKRKKTKHYPLLKTVF